MPMPSNVTAVASSAKYPLPGVPSVRAMARVTKSYVTRDAGRSAIGSRIRCAAVYHLREIRDRRQGVEPSEDVIAARVLREGRHARGLVVQVAEHDRLRRAGLRARGRDVAVLHFSILEPRPVLGTADPLHAEGALLHHALLPHRDVGIEQHVERVRPALPLPTMLGVVVPVEVADLVRTVVGAIARAHAPIVDLAVQAVRCVVGGVYGAHGLTGRVTALLAQHRRHDRARSSGSTSMTPRPCSRASPSMVARERWSPVFVTVTLTTNARPPKSAGSGLKSSKALKDRSFAYRPYALCPCPVGTARTSGRIPGVIQTGARTAPWGDLRSTTSPLVSCHLAAVSGCTSTH